MGDAGYPCRVVLWRGVREEEPLLRCAAGMFALALAPRDDNLRLLFSRIYVSAFVHYVLESEDQACKPRAAFLGQSK